MEFSIPISTQLNSTQRCLDWDACPRTSTERFKLNFVHIVLQPLFPSTRPRYSKMVQSHGRLAHPSLHFVSDPWAILLFVKSTRDWLTYIFAVAMNVSYRRKYWRGIPTSPKTCSWSCWGN
jgi:hypothetical protein